MEKMKAAIYARVSDDKKQRDGEFKQDVQRQVQLLGNPLKEKGIEFVPYIDEGKSAFTEDINGRPAFKQLLNDCRRNFIKTIYIEDLTRFSRNLSIGLRWLKELGELDVQVISMKEGEIEVTSSKGWMQSTILLMFAEWDSRIKSEKVKSGMAKAKREGKIIGGRRTTHPAPLKLEDLNTLAREYPKP
jgi:DNA invertase Pin-like site-specific DNA recombinase